MRLALVGPTHPYTGGIVHHTTELAHRLAAAGHETDLVSWSAQYPRFLYPGTPRVPVDQPEVVPYPRTSYRLSWRRPDGWWRVAVALRQASYDVVVLVVVTPLQAPAYLTMLAALRRGDRRGDRSRPRVVALCHNVMPHERRALDVPLMRALLRRFDGVLVHSDDQAALARSLGSAHVEVAPLPPHLPSPPAAAAPEEGLARRLLFFGTVRRYKGLDVLLEALAAVPGVRLRVAGEFWGGVAATERQVAALGLAERVELRPGYVPGEAVGALFHDVDALVLPYRSGTASQNVWLAHEHGVPVIATRVGTLAESVDDGVDGLLCAPGDAEALAAALRRFYANGTAQRLRAGVRAVDHAPLWEAYIHRLVAAGS